MISQKQVTYCTEVDALLGLVVQLLSDIKAKKSVGEDIADLLPPFAIAIGKLGDLSAEMADPKAVEATVALKVVDMVSVFV